MRRGETASQAVQHSQYERAGYACARENLGAHGRLDSAWSLRGPWLLQPTQSTGEAPFAADAQDVGGRHRRGGCCILRGNRTAVAWQKAGRQSIRLRTFGYLDEVMWANPLRKCGLNLLRGQLDVFACLLGRLVQRKPPGHAGNQGFRDTVNA